MLQKSAPQPGNADYEVGESSVQLSYGKMLVAVSRPNVYLVRYLANGLLDSTFANSGRSSRFFINRPKLLKLADGRLLLIGTGYGNGISIAIQRLLADGAIDPSFNGGNMLMVPYSSPVPGPVYHGTLPDGKLLLLATTPSEYSANNGPSILRLLPNGMPDLTFGTGSKELPGFPKNVRCIGMSLSGSRINSGYIHPQTGNIILVAHNTNGGVDSAFGNEGNGKVDLGVQPLQQTAALSALADGRILVGLNNLNPANNQQWQEVRCLLPNGNPDPEFGTNGTAVVPQTTTVASGIWLAPDTDGFNSISYSSFGTYQKVTFTRFNNAGRLQTTYGINGQQFIQFTADYLEVKEATVNSNKQLTLIGRLSTYPSDYFFLTRINANGQPDNTWSAGGTKFDFFPSKRVEMDNIKPMSSGSLLVRYTGMGITRQTGIIKLTPKGSTDTTFATKGLLSFDSRYFDTLSNGGLITAEPSTVSTSPNPQVKLSRYGLNGRLDNSFGNAGVRLVSMPLNFQLTLFRVLPGNKLLLYGSFYNFQNNYRYVLCRLLADGTPDASFGENGLAYLDNTITSTREIVNMPDGGLLISGDYSNYSTNPKFGMTKLLSNGKLDPSFGNNGIVTDSSGQGTYSQKVMLQPDGNIIVAYYALLPSNGYYKVVLGRYNAQGQRIQSFGNNGTGILDLNTTTFAVLPDSRLLALSLDYNYAPPMLRLELRNSNGVIDSTFGIHGVERLPVPAANFSFMETVYAGNKIYLRGAQYEEFETNGLIGSLLIDTTSAAIASFTLVDATSNKDIRTIKEGDIINIADVRGKSVNIRANTNGAPVGSVVMTLSGAQQKTQTESSAPFALFGNTNNDYWNWTPVAGQYSLYARPFKGTKGAGAPGKALNVSFRVKDELTLAGLSLINADNNRVIRSLVNNSVVDLAYTPNINVRANPGVGYTESVLFMVNGFYHRVENTAPFAIAADNNGDYNNWNITPGVYNIAAFPYPENDAKGLAGTPYNIWINVINSAPVAGSSIKSSGNAPALKNEGGFTVGVYPNPTSGEGTLTYGALKTSYLSVTLFDATGAKVQQVFNGKVEGGVLYRTALNIRHLKAGTYFYRILTADGGMQTVQVVKQ
ncbi:hypothetical protein BUE76_17500 [Cnuella takakiae]|nr:hypothetical protein BUE76_17500 [Cnuella takakiae]